LANGEIIAVYAWRMGVLKKKRVLLPGKIATGDRNKIVGDLNKDGKPI
jgi:hypothetical protein